MPVLYHAHRLPAVKGPFRMDAHFLQVGHCAGAELFIVVYHQYVPVGEHHVLFINF